MNKVVWSIFTWIYICVVTISFSFIAIVIFLFSFPFDKNKKVVHFVASIWAKILLMGNPFWHFKIINLSKIDKAKNYVIVANHQSFGDILVSYGLMIQYKWIAKKSLFSVPLLGWAMWMAGYIPVIRDNKESRIECMNKCLDWLKRGVSVMVFPEGTRSKDGKIKEFKHGAFRMAIEAKCDILPVSIHGTRYALPKGSFVFNEKIANITMVIDKPISFMEIEKLGIEETKNLVRNIIVRNFESVDKGLF